MDLAHEFERAFASTAVFTHCEADESGDPRIVAQVPFPPAPRSARVLMAIDETPELRRKLWAIEPTCCECDELIDAPDLGAVVPTDGGARLAHRAVCLPVALQANQAQLTLKAAVGRAGRGTR